MKPRSPLPLGKPMALAGALLGLAFASLAAPAHTNAPFGSAPAVTNAAPALPPIPQSVFSVPLNPQEGKDPFFPLSMRIFNDVVVKTNQQPVAVIAVELKLNGISGTADHRLAIINNRTFGVGEEGEVASSGGRVHIICKDIKADSVLVLVAGEERILRLRTR